MSGGGISETQLQRLEKESERFTNEIKQKEKENELLRDQVLSIKSQLEETQKLYAEISKVCVRYNNSLLHRDSLPSSTFHINISSFYYISGKGIRHESDSKDENDYETKTALRFQRGKRKGDYGVESQAENATNEDIS